MVRLALVQLWHVVRHLSLTLILPQRSSSGTVFVRCHCVKLNSSAAATSTAPCHLQRSRFWSQGKRKGQGHARDPDAIAAVAAAGSGVVLFPSGGTYLRYRLM